MALHSLGPVLFSTNPEDQINFLKSKGLLRTQQDCSSCGISMAWKRRPTCGDKFTWRCPNCNCMKSIRNESFFSKSKLPLQTWLQLMHHWSMDMPVTQAAKQAKISEKRCIDIYQYMRDVCSTKLLSAPIILGGPGTVVQIDESLFVYNRRVGTNHFTFPYTCYPHAEWSWPSTGTRTVGIWDGGHILKACHRVHEIGPRQDCSYTNGNHYCPCGSWYRNLE